MGCTISKNEVQPYQFQQKNQKVVGQLCFKIISIKLEKQFIQAKTQSFVKIRMSNQQFKTPIHKNNGKLISLDDSFCFCVNSLNKIYGRMLSVQIFGNQSKSQKDVALGIIDINPFLAAQSAKFEHEERIFLNYQTKAAGHINTAIQFQPYPYQKIMFRINTIFIRKNTNSHRNISVRITIGEQIQETSTKKDSQDSVPTWKSQQKIFVVPSFVGEVLIQVLSKHPTSDQIIGELTLDLKFLLSTYKPLMHNEVLNLNNKITGSIIFDTVKNKDHDFAFSQELSPRLIVKNISTDKENNNRQNRRFINPQVTLDKKPLKNSCHLLLPPILNPNKLPIVSKKQKLSIENKSLFLTTNNSVIMEELSDCRKSFRQHQDENSVKIIQIPSPMARQQTKRMHKNSFQQFSISLIPITIQHIFEDDTQGNSIQANKNKTKILVDTSQSQTKDEKDIENLEIDDFSNKISRISMCNDTSRNSSGKYFLNEINNALGEQKRKNDTNN